MLVAPRTVEGEQVNESRNASVTVRRFTMPELCGARSSRAQRRRFAAVGVLAAVLVSGCDERSNGVTVTRASGSLGVARGGPLRPTTTNWASLLHTASHFGAAPVAGPSRARVRWQRRLEGPIVPGPVAAGNVAYVASNGGVLHAIDVRSGRDRWSFSGGGHYGSDLSTAPTVLADGLILWPGPRHRLFALTAQGGLRWTLSAPGDPLSPAVDEMHGRFVLADQSGGLSGYRLGPKDAAPVHLWSRSLANTSFGNPALAADGTTYETAGNSLFAVAPDGRLRWQVHTPAQVEVSAAVGEDGTVVFGSNDRQEYGVMPDGRVRWRHAIGDYTYSSPLTVAGHRVVFGNHSDDMSILDILDGHLISRDHGSGQLWTAAAVDVRGDVYFASRKGGIYGFGPDGRRLFTIQAGGTFDSYPAIAADGTLLLGGDDGVLRAIR